MILAVFLHISHTLENSGSWDMGQNVNMGQYGSTNQIAVFLNWLYLYNKMMKKPDFLHVDGGS